MIDERKKRQFLEGFKDHACAAMVSAAATAARARRYQEKPTGDLVTSLPFRTLEHDLAKLRRWMLKQAEELRQLADAMDPTSSAAGAAPPEKEGRRS